MKTGITLVLFACCFTLTLSAQNFTGQWKGSFVDNSTKYLNWGGDKCDYVLELETKGTTVSGYSYTYFTDGEKRYYTICKLKGTIDKGSRSVEVREYERTKTNVPQNIRNCFQVHRLTYFNKEDEQTLDGSWIPAPNQEGDCGYGTTVLSRRVLKRNNSLANLNTAKKTPGRTPVTTKPKTSATQLSKTIVKTPARKTITPTPPVKSKVITAPVVKATVPSKLPPAEKEAKDKPWLAESKPEIQPEISPKPAYTSFEKRNNTLIKTIEVEKETVKVDLYDNGEIDGDSISLFLNGKLLLSHKRLSDKAITLNLDVTSNDINDLVMYADNLGSIPPNTALMVVTDGDKRYEVRIASDLQKSGAIRFIHRPKTGQ